MPPRIPTDAPALPIPLHEDAPARRRVAAVRHHREQLLALTRSAASWRAPLASLAQTG